MSQPLKRLTGGLLGLLLSVLVGVSSVQASPARAQSADEVRVTLTSITPTVLGPGGELVITGTLANESLDALGQVEVMLWRDARPLTTLEAMQAALADTRQTGDVMSSPAARQLIKGGEPLAPGESAEFTVRAVLGPDAAEQSWLSVPDAAYRVGVEVFGRPPDDAYQQLGRAFSLMAYPGTTPVATGTVVVLNRRPSLLPLAAAPGQPAVFADDSLAGELDGRLEMLLRLGEQDGVLTVIDPALYDEVAAQARGYRVEQPDGHLVSAAPAAVAKAAAWLVRVDALAGQQRLARAIYGCPDILGATTVGRPDIIAQARDAMPHTHPLARLPLVVVPADYQLDLDTVNTAASTNPWLVLSANLAGNAVVQTADGVSLLAVTPDLTSEAASMPQLRGRLLSQQLISAREGLVMVSAISTEQQASVEMASEPWRTREPVAALLAAHPEPGPFGLSEMPYAEVAPEVVEATDRAIALLNAWEELMGDQSAEDDAVARIVSTSWSFSFARDSSAQQEWLARTTSPAVQVLTSDAVQLRISDWVTTSADDNLLPVTVINNAAHPVQVRVHFQSDNPLRISVDDSDLFTVQPGESTTVRVRPRTHGNGAVAITAHLTTASGHPFGQPTSFVITGTDAGRVGWLIIVASGAVLLVAGAIRVRQVRREHRTS